jgi:hypothetical protein
VVAFWLGWVLAGWSLAVAWLLDYTLPRQSARRA